MAITTNNEKLAIMEWCQVWEPGLPLSPGALGQDDKQQLLWGYPGVLWGEAVAPAPTPAPQIETGGGGGFQWPGHQYFKDKREAKAILQDDEDFMRLIEEALPKILKDYY